MLEEVDSFGQHCRDSRADQAEIRDEDCPRHDADQRVDRNDTQRQSFAVACEEHLPEHGRQRAGNEEPHDNPQHRRREREASVAIEKPQRRVGQKEQAHGCWHGQSQQKGEHPLENGHRTSNTPLDSSAECWKHAEHDALVDERDRREELAGGAVESDGFFCRQC
jgi:hypothetical protein